MRIAIYTTVYPGVERFLSSWYQSVRGQTDSEFDIWMGVDSLDRQTVLSALGETGREIHMMLFRDASPASIRQRVLSQIAGEYAGIVFTDSDDLLMPTRVEAAKEQLKTHDMSACALRIVDEEGQDTGSCLGPEPGTDPVTLLDRYNVFGLSNTAYRGTLLSRCLPLPPDCILMDWLLATRAWAAGARIFFDPIPRMGYRQHAANVARVSGAFEPDQILAATRRVQRHYEYLSAAGETLPSAFRSAVEKASERVRGFERAIANGEDVLQQYARALNALPRKYVWWWCVAHPELEPIWKH